MTGNTFVGIACMACNSFLDPNMFTFTAVHLKRARTHTHKFCHDMAGAGAMHGCTNQGMHKCVIYFLAFILFFFFVRDVQLMVSGKW